MILKTSFCWIKRWNWYFELSLELLSIFFFIYFSKFSKLIFQVHFMYSLKLLFKLFFFRLYSLEEGCYPAVRHQVPQLQGIWYSPWSNCFSVFLSILGHRYHGQCHPYPHYSQVRQFFATKSNNVRLIKSIYKPEFVSILLPNLTNWSDFNCNVITKTMGNFWSDW